ncbi:MAG: MarR family winged helix-turn-helix transcriptional regulator [Coriobacteriia bacterium]
MSTDVERLSALMPLMQHSMAHLGAQSTPTGRKLGLTNTRMAALAAVTQADRLTMTALAAALDLPAPLATRTVDELVERGLMQRHSDQSDRRRVLIGLTRDGLRAFDDVHREGEQLIASILEHMTDAETDALILGLEAMMRAMHGPAGLLAKHKHP